MSCLFEAFSDVKAMKYWGAAPQDNILLTILGWHSQLMPSVVNGIAVI